MKFYEATLAASALHSKARVVVADIINYVPYHGCSRLSSPPPTAIPGTLRASDNETWNATSSENQARFVGEPRK